MYREISSLTTTVLKDTIVYENHGRMKNCKLMIIILSYVILFYYLGNTTIFKLFSCILKCKIEGMHTFEIRILIKIQRV